MYNNIHLALVLFAQFGLLQNYTLAASVTENRHLTQTTRK